MRYFPILIFISFLSFAQSNSITIQGYELKIGMSSEEIVNLVEPEISVMDDEVGNYFLADASTSTPLGMISFKNDKVVKIIKDWGTAYKTNVGQVFKTLWNIFRQYGKETELVKILPKEVYGPSGEKFSLSFYLEESKYIEINIMRNVLISEIVEKPSDD
jgi:hypothetical protein